MNQKRTKGFTLIELLAVIVILAIIALIAVPVIVNIIDKARKSAFKDTAYGIVNAAELYFAEMQLEPNGMLEDVTITLPDERLKVKGNVPEGTVITITKDGKISLTTHNEKWCAIKETDSETLNIVEYKDGKCQSEESNIMYYGNMKTNLYEVSLTGGITKYNGNKEDLVVPSSFNIDGSTYGILPSDICVGENNTKLSDSECQKAKQQALIDAYYYQALGYHAIDKELHAGYMVFEDVKFDYDACVENFYNVFNELSFIPLTEPAEKVCTLDYLSRYGLYDLYELGAIEANVKTVDIPVVESFNYELNEQSCINFAKQNDPTITDEQALTGCYIDFNASLTQPEIIEFLLDEGIITKKSGYRKYEDFTFDVQACSDKFYALGYEQAQVNGICHKFSLTNNDPDFALPIEFFYKTGIVTANKTTTYLQEGEVIEKYLYELPKDEAALKEYQEWYPGTTEDEAWIMTVANADSVVSEGGLEEILQFAESKTGSILFKNIQLQPDRCKEVFTTIGNTEEEINTSCNLQFFYENQIPIKAMYDLGVIKADLEYLNMNAEGQKVDTKFVDSYSFGGTTINSIVFPNTLEYIAYDTFSSALASGPTNITGEIDLSKTKLIVIEEETFDGLDIKTIKLPNTLEVIEEKAFYDSEIENISFSNLTNLTTIGYSAFSNTQITGTLDLSNTKLTKIGSSAFERNNITSVILPSSVETIETNAFVKHISSNQNLTTIINPTGKEFDWSSITWSSTPNQVFATGTITHQEGNIEVKSK